MSHPIPEYLKDWCATFPEGHNVRILIERIADLEFQLFEARRKSATLQEALKSAALGVTIEQSRAICRAAVSQQEATLQSALERTAYALELAFSGKLLRDMTETLAEAKAALNPHKATGTKLR